MPVSQQTHNHNPKNLIMAVSQQKNKQTQSQHLTMAVSPQKKTTTIPESDYGSVSAKKQPQSQNLNCGIVAATSPKSTPQYGIVAEETHPTSDCGIVAAQNKKSHI